MEKILYHGTDEKFSSFHQGNAVYFFDNSDSASCFGKNIAKCSVNLENSLKIDCGGQSWGGIFLSDLDLQHRIIEHAIANEENKDSERTYFEDFGLTVDFIADWAESQGYDSVIVYDVVEDDYAFMDDQYVILKASCIKDIEWM